MNKDLEAAVVRTIAGFLNHHGGSLLVGITDTGQVIGLELDYGTLRRHDRDGFQQFVVTLVKTRLGGDVCPLVHVDFQRLQGRDVCWIVVEPSPRPVYCQDEGVARYFLRTGNSTRELDVREAMRHIADRWPARRSTWRRRRRDQEVDDAQNTG